MLISKVYSDGRARVPAQTTGQGTRFMRIATHRENNKLLYKGPITELQCNQRQLFQPHHSSLNGCNLSEHLLAVKRSLIFLHVE